MSAEEESHIAWEHVEHDGVKDGFCLNKTEKNGGKNSRLRR